MKSALVTLQRMDKQATTPNYAEGTPRKRKAPCLAALLHERRESSVMDVIRVQAVTTPLVATAMVGGKITFETLTVSL